MGFLCCICHEDLTRKEKTKVESEEGNQENVKVPERPLVTTKCGHLFHSDCLSAWFQKQGTEVWTKKECPTCRMSLTVATDLIRIFTNSADDGSPSIDDFKLHISKLENANTVLSNNLEMSFLRGRDQEKKISQMSRDSEKLQKAYILEKSKVSSFQSEAAKLRNENEELKNVIINLNKAMTSGNNGIQLGGVQYAINGDGQPVVLPMFGYNAVQQNSSVVQGLQQQQGLQGLGNMNIFSNGNNTMLNNQSLGSQTQQQLLQTSSWPPPIKSTNYNNGQVNATNGVKNEAPTDHFGFMNPQNHNSNKSIQMTKAEDLTQLNAMFQGMMGLPGLSSGPTTLYGDREAKSFVEENNSSSCLDSDSSPPDSETGDNSTKKMFSGGSTNNDGNSHSSSDNNGNCLTSTSISNHRYNDSSSNNNGGLTAIIRDQTPTDELMDEILNSNSKSQPVVHNKDEYFVQKKFIPPASSSRAPKGKTKWKAYEPASDDKKMYGKFACKNCSSKWGTSRHVFNQAQTCLRCNEVVFPYDQGPVMTKEELAQQKLARSRNKPEKTS